MLNYGATVKSIDEIRSIEGAEKVELVVLYTGNTVVVPKGKFKKGDRVFWVKPGAWVDNRLPQFKFLKRHRVKKRKILNVESEGLVFKQEEFGVEPKYYQDSEVCFFTKIPRDLKDEYPGKSLALTTRQKTLIFGTSTEPVEGATHTKYINIDELTGCKASTRLLLGSCIHIDPKINSTDIDFKLLPRFAGLYELYKSYNTFRVVNNPIGHATLLGFDKGSDGVRIAYRDELISADYVNHNKYARVLLGRDYDLDKVLSTRFYKKLTNELKDWKGIVSRRSSHDSLDLANPNCIYSGSLYINEDGTSAFRVSLVYNKSTRKVLPTLNKFPINSRLLSPVFAELRKGKDILDSHGREFAKMHKRTIETWPYRAILSSKEVYMKPEPGYADFVKALLICAIQSKEIDNVKNNSSLRRSVISVIGTNEELSAHTGQLGVSTVKADLMPVNFSLYIL